MALNFESPGALRRRIDAVQFAEESLDELSLGMARRAPSGVDSSMLSLADTSRDITIESKSVGRDASMHARVPSPPPGMSPFPQPLRTAPTSKATERRPHSSTDNTVQQATTRPQQKALTPTTAPSQDRYSSSQGSASDDDTPPVDTSSLKQPLRATTTSRPEPRKAGDTAFSVAARRIRLANGTSSPTEGTQRAEAQASPSSMASTPRATSGKGPAGPLSSTPSAAQNSQSGYAPSTVSTSSSNDLLTPVARRLGRANTSLPGLVGPDSVLPNRTGAGNMPASRRIAAGNAVGAHVDVGKLAAYQHKINERLEEENTRLRDDAEQLTGKVEELEDELERRQTRLDQALTANTDLRKRLEQHEKTDRHRDIDADKLNVQRQRLQTQLDTLEKDYAELETETFELRDEGKKMLAELEDLNAEMEQKNKDLVDALRSNEELTRRVKQLEREARSQSRPTGRDTEQVLRGELDEAQRMREQLEDDNAALKSDKNKLQAEIDELRTEARISRMNKHEVEQLKDENDYLQQEVLRLTDEVEDLGAQLEDQRALPARAERSQTVRFDESVAQHDGATSRPSLRTPSVRSAANKTFDLSMPNLANLSSMSWLNETTIGDDGMLAVIQQLQREVDERNQHVDDLLSKLDAYGKLLLQLGEKYEVAQRKLAALALVEQDHDRMLVEREEILEDVSRLERDMRQVRTEAAQIGQELEALRSVKAAYKAESSLDTHLETIGKLRQHHVEECKGLMLRIRYLKAKWTREANLRSDLSYQKSYLLQLVGGLERDLAATRAYVADVGASRGVQRRSRTPRNKLKEAMLAVLAVVRMRSMMKRWQQASASKAVLSTALLEARARRQERQLSDNSNGRRPDTRVSA